MPAPRSTVHSVWHVNRFSTGRCLVADPFRFLTASRIVQAHAPDQAVRAYRERGRWEDALRVARHWRPELVGELEATRAAATHRGGVGGAPLGGIEEQLQHAKTLERQVSKILSTVTLLPSLPPMMR